MVPARLEYFPTQCMSIAVSAVVRTPVFLRLLQACLGLCALLAAWPLSGCWPLLPTPLQGAGAHAWALPASIASVTGGAWLLRLSCRRAVTHRLDISPVGQLRLAVYLEADAPDSHAQPSTGASAACLQPPAVWQLLPGSTLWPGLLVLCLADCQGRRCSVLAWRGARSCPQFRALAVACRTVAARKEQGGVKKVHED